MAARHKKDYTRTDKLEPILTIVLVLPGHGVDGSKYRQIQKVLDCADFAFLVAASNFQQRCGMRMQNEIQTARALKNEYEQWLLPHHSVLAAVLLLSMTPLHCRENKSTLDLSDLLRSIR